MRARPLAMLIWLGAVSVLSAACRSDPAGGLSPELPPMQTTMHGVVRWYADSTPVAGLTVGVIEFAIWGEPFNETQLTSTTTDSNGAYRISFLASCQRFRHYGLKLPCVYRGRVLDPSDAYNRVCTDPDITADLWIEPNTNPAIAVNVQPRLTDTIGKAFGAIRDGTYLDSLRVKWLDPQYMMLWAGAGRRGTYSVTVAAPGYVTWDTTGVRVEGTECNTYTKNLSVQLEETP